MKKIIRKTLFVLILSSAALVAACSGNVGVGLNVGVPIGNHGHLSFGTGNWY
jgi:hypothetical protein